MKSVKYEVMRKLLLMGLVVLAGCQGTQAYLPQDLTGVKVAEATVIPLYKQFKVVYKHHDVPGMKKTYAQEQQACKQVDVIDKRDTIDPNVNLFQASAFLDNFCNAIESGYAFWEKSQGLPYDKDLTTGLQREIFISPDSDLKTIGKLMRHPAAQS